jgi:hypothetical protein
MVSRQDISKRPGADRTSQPSETTRADIAAFLAEAQNRKASTTGRPGRLLFALDATMSRQPTWDLACQLQSEMFDAAARVGSLSVQLIYFRGHREARASRWVSDAAALKSLMTGIACHGGLTQIGRVLDHAEKNARRTPLAALVYVGDAMEENIDRLCQTAGALGLRGTRAFMFQEGHNPEATRAFGEIARLTGGVHLPFNASAAGELRELLAAIGTFAAGGRAALEASGTAGARRLLSDLRP